MYEDTDRDNMDTDGDAATPGASATDRPDTPVTPATSAAADTVILVTTAEAAAMAAVSARTIRRWINRGILPAEESADGYMVSPADIPAAQRAAGHGQRPGTRTEDRYGDRDRAGRTAPDRDTGPAGDAATSALSNRAAREQLEAIREEWLAPLVAQISEQAETIGRLTERTERQHETIASLESERERLEARLHKLEAQPEPQPEMAPEPPTPPSQRQWWRFWVL